MLLLSTLSCAGAGEVTLRSFHQVHALIHAGGAGTCGREGSKNNEKLCVFLYDVAFLIFVDSPAGRQWKPTVTLVVRTGKHPGMQRSTGSTE